LDPAYCLEGYVVLPPTAGRTSWLSTLVVWGSFGGHLRVVWGPFDGHLGAVGPLSRNPDLNQI